MENLVTAIAPKPPSLDVDRMRVLVTGHTGFKGAWLSEWLLQLGAHVSGVALPPESSNSLFTALRLGERVRHTLCDICDATSLREAVRVADPEIIFHLAAQALVRRSYNEPLRTWQTNVNGTLNLLEAANALGRAVTVVVVTTDKVYRNREWEFAYREEDELGGHDPYSASKAACELAVASWRDSFGAPTGVTVVTARAGNVIGCGDFSEDRIVPDCFRAWDRAESVSIRSPNATRPWQHVLEPLSGYFVLAAHARSATSSLVTCNFGPGSGGEHTVLDLVRTLAGSSGTRRWQVTRDATLHEAHALSLSIDRARQKLCWTPRLSFAEAIDWTGQGYIAGPTALPSIVERQLADFNSRGNRLQGSTA